MMAKTLTSLFGRRKATVQEAEAELVRMLREEKRSAELAVNLAKKQIEELGGEVERLRAAESELLAAKRDAETAALAKGEFLATMSHEIRTPLNGILPILELVLGRELEDELRHQVAAAFESAKEMRRIVNDVLDFSKLEVGAMQLESASMRPIDLVQSVCTLMKRSADAKHLRLVCEVDRTAPPAVRGDALRLRQVLTNLIGNAIKFTSRGEVTVEISQIAEDRSHRTLRFAVRDTGMGIAPEAAARLFQPFAQAEASMARTHGGTGLGLAICRRIVDAMGGRIGVESTLGRGSTFWFTVPLLRSVGEAPSVGSEQSVLLLTRDEGLRDLWTHNLTGLDFRCTTLATAYETLSQLRTTLSTRGAAALPQLLVIDLASASRTAASLTRPVLAEEGFGAVRMLLLGDNAEGLIDDESADRIVLAPRQLRDAAAHRVIRGALAAPGDEARASSDGGPDIRLSNEPPARFDGLRVLLVDDIAINRYAGQLSLQKLGCRVTLAGGGREALELLRRGSFDLILMDCQMPDVDGFSAARVQRLHERAHHLPRTPILAVTANAMPGDRERCLEAGMDDHLAKPIEIGPLSRMLMRWVQGKAVAG
jgi:signal transduction histidine kinase/CheY-like chemotaxis protein